MMGYTMSKANFSWYDYEPGKCYTLTKDQTLILAGLNVKRSTKWVVIQRSEVCKHTFDFTLSEMIKYFPKKQFMQRFIVPEYAKEQARYCILVRIW